MAKAIRGLGRGLDALLSNGSETAAAASDAQRNVAISALRPGKFQPRTRFDAAALEELAASIKAQGLLQPIVVRAIGVDGYEILAGERRWRAAQLAGLLEVPVLLRDVPDSAAIAVALIENIQREDLNPIEEASGLQRLIDEFRMTHDEAAQAVGRSRSAVTNLLRLLNLAPTVRELLMNGELEMGHARALLALSPLKQAEIAQRIAQERLSVRQAERLVHQLQQPKTAPGKSVDRDVQRLEEELSENLGARVQIRAGRKGKGALQISYQSLKQLDDILARLRRGG